MPDSAITDLILLGFIVVLVLGVLFLYEDKSERKQIAQLVAHGLEESEAAAIVRQYDGT